MELYLLSPYVTSCRGQGITLPLTVFMLKGSKTLNYGHSCLRGEHLPSLGTLVSVSISSGLSSLRKFTEELLKSS